MMALGTVVQLIIQIARAFGLVADDVLAYARQVQPELRTDPLPDAAGDMYAAREAAIHRAYQGEIRAAVAAGDMRGQRAEDAIARARAAAPDSPEAVEVYGDGVMLTNPVINPDNAEQVAMLKRVLAPRKEGAS